VWPVFKVCKKIRHQKNKILELWKDFKKKVFLIFVMEFLSKEYEGHLYWNLS